MAGAVPGLSRESEDTLEDTLARPVSGLMSQVMGVDPVTDEVKFPPLENLKRSWNADERRKQGLPPQPKVMPGILTDTASIPNILGNGPKFSREAQELADATHGNVNQDMGLAPPQGFRQHGLEAFGTMLGQIPVAGSSAAKPTIQGGLNLLRHYGKKIALSPWEFLSPTVEPKMSNYLMGAGAGGALGTLGDEVPLEEIPPPRAIGRAKGGKVGALTNILRAISINPDATVKKTHHMIGDPVEEVLYASNEGQRTGVLSTEEAKRIRELMASGEEDQLADALMDLQQRLFKVQQAAPQLKKEAMISAEAPQGSGILPSEPSDVPYLDPAPKRIPIAGTPTKPVLTSGTGGGQLTHEEYERIMRDAEARGLFMGKAQGGKVKLVENLLRMFKDKNLDPHELGVIDEHGNLDIDEAKAALEDAVEGEREVDDFVDELGTEDPTEITKKIRSRVNPDEEIETDIDQYLKKPQTRREPEQGEVPDSEWERIRNRMKGWKVQSVYDLEDLLPTQTTEQLKLKVPAIGKKSQVALDVLKNPKSQEDVIRWAGREIPQVRFMTDQDGNTYVWDANRAIHPQVMKALGLDRSGLFHEMSDTPIPPRMFDQYFFSNPWE
jgi:hypothetical protein